MKKDYIKESETLDMVYSSTLPISFLNKSQVSLSRPEEIASILKNNLNLTAYYYEDSDGYIFKSIDLFYLRNQITQDLGMGVDAGIFSAERKGVAKYDGIRYGMSFFYNHFSLRLGENIFEDFSEFVPTIKYQNQYENHNYVLEYTRQNALFYVYSIVPYEKRITADHFSLTDYATFSSNRSLWSNLEFNAYTNGDTEITGQFDYIFYHGLTYWKNFTYNLGLEGWYTSHSKQHNDFYSPSFADTTMLRVDPQYVFSKYFGLRGSLALGYSITDAQMAYKYGLWGFGEIKKNMPYSIGCLQSNSARNVGGRASYYYNECTANLGYTW